MNNTQRNKKKIVNDPVHGFIAIPSELIFDLIEHPVFQRLRRIRQLGLTNYVYPGANHTRFQHAIGATHLMQTAITSIRNKGLEVTDEEAEAAGIAILLHDIGHGPFSHALEYSIVDGITHEDVSNHLMHMLNNEFNGRLNLAIDIFTGSYHKKFLHQLVSSQLDMDRLDYLRRDSFFTGVTEGAIGSSRIIKMLHVVNDKLVVEAKGIYSIEKFLIARRLMYWQVYLHKTVLAAETLLVGLLNRAKLLGKQGVSLYAPPALQHFLTTQYSKADLDNTNRLETLLSHFIELDDSDIFVAAKAWAHHPDKVLSYLAKGLLNRQLPAITIRQEPFGKAEVDAVKEHFINTLNWSHNEIEFMVYTDQVTNSTYNFNDDSIQILMGNGELIEIDKASDIISISALNKTVKKYYLCYPKL